MKQFILIAILLAPVVLFAQTAAEESLERANANIELEDFEAAIEEVNKALELYPDYPDAFLTRAAALIGLGN
jgi:Tfp pilus assembly protein PilF